VGPLRDTHNAHALYALRTWAWADTVSVCPGHLRSDRNGRQRPSAGTL
jgi:hypothetical protein